MGEDPADGTTVLFGGEGYAGPLADTWTFDGTVWTRRTPAVSPPARQNAQLAYDPASQQMILFGGTGTQRVLIFGGTETVGPAVVGLTNETWAWGRLRLARRRHSDVPHAARVSARRAATRSAWPRR